MNLVTSSLAHWRLRWFTPPCWLRRGLRLLALPLLCGISGAAVVAGEPKAESAAPLLTEWHEISLPAGRFSGARGMGTDAQGKLWIQINRLVLFWNGREFRPPEGSPQKVRTDVARFIGGGDRPLYLALPVHENEGGMYLLRDGRAVRKCSYFFQNMYEGPGLYVSKTGRLFNWTTTFLSVWDGTAWIRSAAKLDVFGTSVLDAGKQVHFYFNGKLYTVGPEGSAVEHDFPVKQSGPANNQTLPAALWGKSTMIFTRDSKHDLRGYDLESHRLIGEVDLAKIRKPLEDRRFTSLFRAADGSVWASTHFAEHELWRIDVAGTVERIIPFPGLDLTELSSFSLPPRVLCVANGTVWFCSSWNGLVRCRSGKLEAVNWTNSPLCGKFHAIKQGENGTIYAATDHAIFAYRGDLPPHEVPNVRKHWTEYALSNGALQPLQDAAGTVWVCLKDRPDQISSWDGRAWTHRKLPFETSERCFAWLIDDQGHFLMLTADGWWDVGPTGNEKFESRDAVLAAAVKRGAVRFSSDHRLAGYAVVAGGKICHGAAKDKEARYYDGTRWTAYPIVGGLACIYESPAHGFLIQSATGICYKIDGGQLVEVADTKKQSRWLWGSAQLRYYEEEMLKRSPRQVIPVEDGADHKRYLLAPVEMPAKEGGAKVEYVRVGTIPKYDTTPSVAAGRFGSSCGGSFRILAGKLFSSDLQGTPLFDEQADYLDVLDDAAGNTWFRCFGRLFLRDAQDFKIRADHPPTTAFSSVQVPVAASNPAVPGGKLVLFWRFADGPWKIAAGSDELDIHFPRPGKYQVEAVALDRQGCLTPEPLRLEIESTE